MHYRVLRGVVQASGVEWRRSGARARSRKVEPGFRKRSCSNKKLEPGSDSIRTDKALDPARHLLAPAVRPGRLRRPRLIAFIGLSAAAPASDSPACTGRPLTREAVELR